MKMKIRIEMLFINSLIQSLEKNSKIILGETIDFLKKIAYNNIAKRRRFGVIFIIAKPMTSNVRLGEC